MMPDLQTLYVVQTFMCGLSTLILIWHMLTIWPELNLHGQRLRYVTLLWLAMTVTYGSSENVNAQKPWELSSALVLIGGILLVVTMIVSIRESRNLTHRESIEDD